MLKKYMKDFSQFRKLKYGDFEIIFQEKYIHVSICWLKIKMHPFHYLPLHGMINIPIYLVWECWVQLNSIFFSEPEYLTMDV